MRTTLSELLHENGLELKDTVYSSESKAIFDFVLTIGDYFEVKNVNKNLDGTFHNVCEFYESYKLASSALTAKARRELDVLMRKTADVKKTPSEQDDEELRILAAKRKLLRAEIKAVEEKTFLRTVQVFGFVPEELKYLKYKSRAELTSFENMSRVIPELRRTKLTRIKTLPWLTTDLSALRADARSSEPLGIVGGPCLFGQHEVLLEVETTYGVEVFDCSCGRRSTDGDEHADNKKDMSIYEFFLQESGNIRSMSVVSHKTGISYQEYVGLLYVMELAALLGGDVAIIPLPDLAYLKQMRTAAEPLSEALREELMDVYTQEVYRISDMFLARIERLRQSYPRLNVKIVHARDEEIYERFYKGRQECVLNTMFRRRATSVAWRLEAVIDYITMTALPYYLDGITRIVQVDSIDEIDSGRKCQEAYGKKIKIHSLLFPEFISTDNVNTIYNARVEHKSYVGERDIYV